MFLAVGCNKRKDHENFGSLCLENFKNYSGYIEFGGELEERTKDSDILEHPQHYSHGYISQMGIELFSLGLQHKDFYVVK